jgi:DNA-binding IclR family transcriptional regulator
MMMARAAPKRGELWYDGGELPVGGQNDINAPRRSSLLLVWAFKPRRRFIIVTQLIDLVPVFQESDRRAGRDSDGDAVVGTSAGKALALLDAFEHVDTSVGVSELARRTGVPKSTAFRLLAVLENHQLVERQGKRYCLGKRLFELGNRVSFCRPSAIRDSALPFLSDLYELTHETVHLAVLDGTDVLYLEKLFGHHQVKAPSTVGGRVPAYCSAIGKALLASSDSAALTASLERGLRPRTGYTIVTPSLFREELTAVRSQGVAFDREEANVGVTCVASPIFARNGRLLAAISVCGPTSRFAPNSFAGAVLQAAKGIGNTFSV